MNSSWVPAATINKTAPVSRSVLINSASDVFLCVCIYQVKKSSKTKGFPWNGNNVFITRKDQLNRTADCHFRLEVPGNRIRCRRYDPVILVRLPAETEDMPFSKAHGHAVEPAKPPVQGVHGLFAEA